MCRSLHLNCCAPSIRTVQQTAPTCRQFPCATVYCLVYVFAGQRNHKISGTFMFFVRGCFPGRPEGKTAASFVLALVNRKEQLKIETPKCVGKIARCCRRCRLRLCCDFRVSLCTHPKGNGFSRVSPVVKNKKKRVEYLCTLGKHGTRCGKRNPRFWDFFPLFIFAWSTTKTYLFTPTSCFLIRRRTQNPAPKPPNDATLPPGRACTAKSTAC